MTIILVISLASEFIHHIVPLPIPSGIYGILLLFALLQSGLLKVSAIKETSSFLIEVLPALILVTSLGLVTTWNDLKPFLIRFSLISLITTLLVMGISGRVTQWVIRRTQSSNTKKQNKKEEAQHA